MLKSGCSKIDSLFPTDYYPDTYLLFGQKEAGKSIFTLQLACRSALEGEKTLIIDTELMWQKPTLEKWLTYFGKRFGALRSDFTEKIEIIQLASIFDLWSLMGVVLQIFTKEMKSVPIMKYPTLKWTKKGRLDRRTFRPNIEKTHQTQDWMENAPLTKKIREDRFRLVVIDSLAPLVKAIFSSSESHLAGRSHLLHMWTGFWKTLVLRYGITLLATDHGVRFRGAKGVKVKPWGGDAIKTSFKFQVGLAKLTKDEEERIYRIPPERARRARIAYQFRHEFEDIPREELVWLLKDYGLSDRWSL